MHQTTLTIIMAVLIAGCAKAPPPIVETSLPPPGEIDTETFQRAEQVLERVENMAFETQLQQLGRISMSEAVNLMDMGPAVVPLLIRELKTSGNYKYRFWLVDLLGYMNTPKCIIPLVEVVENEKEKTAVRIRACKSIKELGYPAAVDYLLISGDLVKNSKVRDKIQEIIEYLR